MRCMETQENIFDCLISNVRKLGEMKWRGVWNKALSDFWCNVKFSWSFTTEYKEIWKENLIIYQKSLKAFLQAPLQILLRKDLIFQEFTFFFFLSFFFFFLSPSSCFFWNRETNLSTIFPPMVHTTHTTYKNFSIPLAQCKHLKYKLYILFSFVIFLQWYFHFRVSLLYICHTSVSFARN